MEAQQLIEPGARAELERRAARDVREFAAIFAGGFLGALVRAALERSLAMQPGAWPLATFAVNIAGAVMLGVFVTRLQERVAPTLYTRAFLATGVCGALTTFSTLMVELMQMMQGSHWLLAASYGLASLACGFSAVLISSKLVRRGWVR